jgi:hypothetical protein
MTGRLLVFLVPLLALFGLLACKAVDAWLWVADWCRLWRGRRRVRAVVEVETARHVARLVPGQRQPNDPQPWADLIDWRDGDIR